MKNTATKRERRSPAVHQLSAGSGFSLFDSRKQSESRERQNGLDLVSCAAPHCLWRPAHWISVGAAGGAALPEKPLAAVSSGAGGRIGTGSLSAGTVLPFAVLPAGVLGSLWMCAPLWMEHFPVADHRGSPLEKVDMPGNGAVLRRGAGCRLRRTDLARDAGGQLHHGGGSHQRGECAVRDPGAGHYGYGPEDSLRPGGEFFCSGSHRRRG